MPILRNRVVFEVGRGIRAFLGIEAGVVRGKVPSPPASEVDGKEPKDVRSDGQTVNQARGLNP